MALELQAVSPQEAPMATEEAGRRLRRDPEDRIVDREDSEGRREKMFDKTMADSFPASDPPSSLPDPSEDSFELATSGVDRTKRG
jgi:hypothetical protein